MSDRRPVQLTSDPGVARPGDGHPALLPAQASMPGRAPVRATPGPEVGAALGR
jgi:hypothetical protein